MTEHTTTVKEDADRLGEELPGDLSAFFESSVRLLELGTRIGLGATIWPVRVMPQSIRDGVAQGIRASVASTALFPHAMTRAASEVADWLEDSDSEDD